VGKIGRILHLEAKQRETHKLADNSKKFDAVFIKIIDEIVCDANRFRTSFNAEESLKLRTPVKM